MSATHLSLHYRLIFGTKNREPMIAPAWRGKLHAYLGGTVRGLGAIPEEIGGVADHVHWLIGAKATHVRTQDEHHRRRTFREEYVEMLRRSGVEFDERFLD